MNPEIDVGQIEGGFVLGMGCHLTEYSKFDPKTGVLLTDGTWVSWKKFSSERLKVHFFISVRF